MKKRKVRIISMPKAGSGLEVKVNSGMGFNSRQMNWPLQAGEYAEPNIEVKKTISGDPNPNIEAEGGETIVDDRDKDGIAEHYRIQGPRHTKGGVDINAGENAFVFSDTKAMKIKGDVLKTFNKSPNKSITPADIVKQYDINEYLKTLKDPDTDDIQRKTAEMMVANYNKKLGAVALLQESKKGFDAGVPVIAHDYLESIGMNPEMFTQNLGQSEQPDANMARYGGDFPKAQFGNNGDYNRAYDYYMRSFNPNLTANQEKVIWHMEALNGVEPYDESSNVFPINPFDPKNTYYNHSVNELKTLPGKTEAKKSESPDFAELYRDREKKKEEQKIFDYFLNKIQHEKSYWKTYQDQLEKRKQLMAAGKLKDVEEGISEAEQVLKEQLSKPFSNAPSGKGKMPSLGGPNIIDLFFPSKEDEDRANEVAIGFATNQMKALKKDKEELLPLAEKVKPTYKSHAEYKAHLLDPYSPEKRAAQRHFIETHPELFTKPLTAKKAETSVSSPMPGVTADVTQVPLTDTTLSLKAFEALSPQEQERLSKKFGDQNIKFEYQYGGALPKAQYGNKPKTLAEKKAAEAAAKAGQGSRVNSGSYVSPYGEDAEIIKILQDYGVKDAGALYDKNIGHQKANAQGVYGDDITEETWRAGNPGFLKQFETNGKKFAVTDKAHMKEYEKYHYDDTYNKIYNRLKTKMTDAEAQRAAKNVADNLSFSDRHGVSKADQLWGNYHRSRKEIGFNDPEQQRDPGARVETRTPPPEADYKPTVNKFVPGEKRDVPDEYWLQDAIRQHGNARDYLTLKKYMPWQATPDVQLADGIFEDPNRAIAGVNETVNAQNQLMGTFAGPQGLARSQASARGANQIADIIAQTANRNVGYANDLERYNNQVGNQGSAMRAGMATNLFDKTTIANQQFDNSQRAILHNMDDTQIAAETNRAYTHNLNQINPHFNIHPEMGGNMAFTGQADPFAPSYEDPDAWLKKYADYRGKLPASVTDDAIIKIMSQQMGSKSQANPYANMAAAGMYPGGNTPMDPWG